MSILALLILSLSLAQENLLISTSPITANHIDQIAWCGETSDYIFLKTNQGTVYRSQDRGKKFTPITQKLFSALSNDSLEHAYTMASSNASKETIAIAGTDGNNWLTSNCGKKWELMVTDKPIKQIKFHPTNDSIILAMTDIPECHISTEDDDETLECINEADLYISYNKGQTWNIIQSKVLKFDWAPTNAANQDNRIIAVKKIKENEYYLKITDNYFKSTIFERINGFDYSFTSDLIFIADMINPNKGEVALNVGYNSDAIQIQPIKIYSRTLNYNSYFIIDNHVAGVLLYIIDPTYSYYGSLFKSDASGVEYITMLENIPYNGLSPEVELIEGIEGEIIANVLTHDSLVRIKSATKESSLEYKELSKISYISFDMGSKWSLVNAPLKDYNGNKLDCRDEDGCSLHFSWNPRIVHSKEALGIIVAYGNTGNYLKNEFELPHTYYSRDGGLNWRSISKFMLPVAFGDHGGIILAVNDTDMIFSWNEGKTWESFDIESYLSIPTDTLQSRDITTVVTTNKIDEADTNDKQNTVSGNDKTLLNGTNIMRQSTIKNSENISNSINNSKEIITLNNSAAQITAVSTNQAIQGIQIFKNVTQPDHVSKIKETPNNTAMIDASAEFQLSQQEANNLMHLYSTTNNKEGVVTTVPIDIAVGNNTKLTQKYIHARITKIETTTERNSLRFIIFAELLKSNEIRAIYANFENFHEPQCQGADNPNTEASDYEIWKPYEKISNSTCILGKSTSYVRRKQFVECFNGEEFERPIKVENCICTAEDFECDYGFIRNKNGECAIDSGQYKEPSCNDDVLSYNISDGYRKIPGDTCIFGITHSVRNVQCSLLSLNKKPIYIILSIIIVLLAFLTIDYYAIYNWCRSFCTKSIEYTRVSDNPQQINEDGEEDSGKQIK